MERTWDETSLHPVNKYSVKVSHVPVIGDLAGPGVRGTYILVGKAATYQCRRDTDRHLTSSMAWDLPFSGIFAGYIWVPPMTEGSCHPDTHSAGPGVGRYLLR